MTNHLFHTILSTIQHFHVLGYWVALLAAFAETALIVGLFLPGSTFLLFLGALSAGGYLDVGDLLLFAIVGAILGDNLNFWLGKRYGRKWIHSGIWFLKQEHFKKARTFFDSHGAKSVFLGRFIPSIKELAPFVAGTVDMRRRTFLCWNILGGIGWGIEWIGAGYIFAQSLNLAHIWLSRVGIFLVICLGAALITWLLKRYVMRHGQQTIRFFISLRHSISTAIVNNTEVQKLVRTHPRFFRFLRNRTDPKTFFGLPATFMGLAFFYVLILFGGIIEDFITADAIVSLDKNVAQLIAAFRSPDIIHLFLWITELGVWQVVLPVIVAAMLILWLLRRPLMGFALLVSTAGGAGFCALGKLAFHRPRPIEAVILEHSYSFPSGHATIAIAVYGFLGYLLIRSTQNWKLRVNLFFTTVLLIMLIGLSRIVLGVHYLSDVWSGYLVGALWLIIGISLAEWLLTTGKIPLQAAIRSSSRLLSVGLAAAVVVYYVFFAVNFQPPYTKPAENASACILGDVAGFLSSHGLAYSQTIMGANQQPLSVAIVVADKESLTAVFRASGWLPAASPSLHSWFKLARTGMDYVDAPLVPAFWNDRINDVAFERNVLIDDVKGVLTARLWETSYWTEKGKVFVGVTRIYNGIHWGFFHTIAPDVDAARDSLLQSFKSKGFIESQTESVLVKPMVGAYFTRGSFFSRGKMVVIKLSLLDNISHLPMYPHPNK